MAGGYRKMQSKHYDDNIKENEVDRRGNKRPQETRNARIVVVREIKGEIIGGICTRKWMNINNIMKVELIQIFRWVWLRIANSGRLL
jgi:hypothetical protein